MTYTAPNTTTDDRGTTPPARSAHRPAAHHDTNDPSVHNRPQNLHRLAVLEIENERRGGVANPIVAIGPSECTYLGMAHRLAEGGT
jgi:hypothetical protein